MAEPLRILQILRAPIGGLFRHVGDLTRELSRRGHEIGILADSLTSDGLTEERLGALVPFARLGVHRLPMPRVLGAGDFTTPFAVRRLAERLAIEVVHGHGAKGGLNARLARMGVAGRVALYTPHGGVLNYRPGSLTGKAFRQLERLLLRQTDAIIFESAFAQQAYRQTIAEPSCPSPVIHNGLTAAEFEPIALEPGASDFVFIGEFRAVKGIDYLLDALARVKAPDGRPATLIMAGSGPDLAAAKARIAALGLDQRVRLPGVLPARQALAQGRCAVVPSLAESLPYVILEAASARLPVIATRVGGIGEIFGPTEASLLPAADSAALARAMQGFMDDPLAAQREMELRFDFIRTRFSVERMADQIEALYRQALALRRG
jgi:glycosyltransferase involved in cell wall biosynthesis